MDSAPNQRSEGVGSSRRKPAGSASSRPPRAPKRPDTSDLVIADLASAILSRQFRPRVNEIRRLAEYVQKKEARRLDKLARKDAEKTARKLSKIPKRDRKK